MNEFLTGFFDRGFLGNPLLRWVAAVLLALLVAFTLRILKGMTSRRLTRFAAQTEGAVIDDVIASVLSATTGLFIVLVAVYAGSKLLVLPGRSEELLRAALVIVAFMQAALWATRGLGTWLESFIAKRRQTDAASVTAIGVLGLIGRLAIWAIAFLLVVDNLGFDVTALVAGLGIGGIAVALAVQNILGDVFASVSIALDKPFVIGDFIIVDDMLGTVEYIGIKTTRLRSLSGEQLVMSNADLLAARIRNYKRMFERRVVQSLHIAYDTPTDTVERVSAMLRAIVESQDDVRFDRAHFAVFGESALEFEIVFYIRSPDYNRYMDIQQDINQAILRQFRAAGICFAFPTRTVVMAVPPQASPDGESPDAADSAAPA